MTALQEYIADEELRVPTLQEIAAAKRFFKSGRQGRLHYALARCVISEAFQVAKQQDSDAANIDLFMELLNSSIRTPQKFDAGYQACISNQNHKSVTLPLVRTQQTAA